MFLWHLQSLSLLATLLAFPPLVQWYLTILAFLLHYKGHLLCISSSSPCIKHQCSSKFTTTPLYVSSLSVSTCQSVNSSYPCRCFECQSSSFCKQEGILISTCDTISNYQIDICLSRSVLPISNSTQNSLSSLKYWLLSQLDFC